MGGQPAKAARSDLRPERRREKVERRNVRAEGARGPHLDGREGPEPLRGRREDATRLPLRMACCRRHGVQQRVGQDLAHVGARADAALQVALRPELIERAHDRSAREAVLAREVARGGQPCAGAQASLQNVGAQGGVEPAVGGNSSVARG